MYYHTLCKHLLVLYCCAFQKNPTYLTLYSLRSKEIVV